MLAWEPRTLPLVVAAFVAGIGIETFGVYWDLSLQQNVPLDRLSRVYSYDALGSFVFMPVGQILAGPLSPPSACRRPSQAQASSSASPRSARWLCPPYGSCAGWTNQIVRPQRELLRNHVIRATIAP